MKTFIALCSVLVLVGCAPAGPVYQSEDGKFSYNLPHGWTLQEFPGLQYKIGFGTGGQGFTPNLNIVSETFDGPLDVYVDGNKMTIRRMFPDFELVTEGEFQTASGVKGFKVVARASQMGIPLQQAWYFFPAKGEYFVVTASALQIDYAKVEPDFDRSLKTFSLR